MPDSSKRDSESKGVKRTDLLEEMETESERRGFLRRVLTGVGTAVASSLGLSGAVAGHTVEKKSERMAVAREYYSSDQIRKAIESNGANTLQELSDQGHLESRAASEFPIDYLHDSVEEFAQAREGTMVFGILRDGEPTVRIEIKKQLEARTLKLVVFPERDHSFAVISPEEDNPSFGVEDNSTIISTSSDCDCVACYHEKYCGVGCGPYSCSCVYEYWPTQCCSDCCYTGDSCSSCDTDYC